MIGNWLAWKISNGKLVKLGMDPCIGGADIYRLSLDLRVKLDSQGFKTLWDFGVVGDILGGI